MRTNFILIDYENVQPRSFADLDKEHFRVLLFVGANQTKLTFETADAMQRLGDRARYVRSSGHGSNALDFHIAFYLGELAAKEPTAFFHIISKDGGFDPLIQHLKSRKISVLRSKSLEEIPSLKVVNTKSPPERVALVVERLQRGTARPKTLNALSKTVASIFQKALPDSELEQLLAELRGRGIVTVDGNNKVSYVLPESGA